MIQRITDFYRGAEIVAGSILAIGIILASGFFFFTAFFSLYRYNSIEGMIVSGSLGVLVILIPFLLMELGKWIRN